MKSETNTTHRPWTEDDTMDSQIDPEALWHDSSITPEELINMDPLEITREMIEQAEQPETADLRLARLPPRRFSLKQEEVERKLVQGLVPHAFMEAWLGRIGTGSA